MSKKYVSNAGNSPVWVGGVMIAPGEGREVEVPDEAPAPLVEAVVDPDAALRELLAGNVAAVTAALDGLSTETLLQLQALEVDGKNRKGVQEALANAVIAAADAKLSSDDLGAGVDGSADGGADAGADGGAGAGEQNPPPVE